MPSKKKAVAKVLPGVETADNGPLVYFRQYQRTVFEDKTTKILLLEWSRQIGKSYTLANWAVDRLLMQLADPKFKRWDIIVISNSRANGSEFGQKVSEAAAAFRLAAQQLREETHATDDDLTQFGLLMEDFQFKLEVTLEIHGIKKVGRIIVLSASPRTARGFSGDLILDEFAFHENAKAMWAAAEPIISSKPEYLCRIASTHNGPGSLFNRWITMQQYPVSSWSRSKAWGVSRTDPVAPMKIISLKTGQEITPDQARDEASDQNEYDQNYENKPSSESGALLSWEEIHGCTTAPDYQEDSQGWSYATLERLRKEDRPLYVGMDVGRTLDLSVVTVLRREPEGHYTMIATLTMGRMSMDLQKMQVDELFRACKFAKIAVDSGGPGIGLVDFLIRGEVGYRCMGINFSSYVPMPVGLAASGRKEERIPVTERMGLLIKEAFIDKKVAIPPHRDLHNSLHTPEKVVNASGTQVRIAAARYKDESGNFTHADRFWSLALALYGAKQGGTGAFTAESIGQVETGGLLFSNQPIRF